MILELYHDPKRLILIIISSVFSDLSEEHTLRTHDDGQYEATGASAVKCKLKPRHWLWVTFQLSPRPY